MTKKLLTPEEYSIKLMELARLASARPSLNYEHLLVELRTIYSAALGERASVTAARVDVASRAAARIAISRAREAIDIAEQQLVTISEHMTGAGDWDADVYDRRDDFERHVAELVAACVRATKAQLASGSTTTEPATEAAWDAQTAVDELVVEVERLYAEALFDTRRSAHRER